MSWFSLLDFAALSPLVALAMGASAVLLLHAIRRDEDGAAALPYVSVGSILVAAVLVGWRWTAVGKAAGGALILGPFPTFLSLVILGAGAVTVLYSSGYARALGFDIGEYDGLLLLALSGMIYLTAANDLVTAFIAFELMSLSVYALACVHRRERRGYEGAMKYFVLGSFSSAFILFGIALLYGATGTIEIDRMRGLASAAESGVALGGLGLILVGFAFKVGAVPFHSWVPDAYHGAPASVAGFMAVAVKAAAFAILVRVLVGSGSIGVDAATATDAVPSALWVLAVVTMVVGNIVALAQENLKRLLAYSGIAHSGYVLVGLVAATRGGEAGQAGVAAMLFYLLGYAAMTLGAFTVLTMLRRGDRDLQDISDLSGLSQSRPVAALCLTVCLLSLVGMPPTVGFFGKLWLFRAAMAADMAWLVVVSCVATAVSIYYYLRPIVLMYTAEPKEQEFAETTLGGRVALALTTGATVLLGVMPSWAFSYAWRSAL